MREGTAVPPEFVAAMVGRHRRDDDPIARLTERQRAVLDLMARGHSSAAMAEHLGVSDKAVVRHTSNIGVLAVVRFLSM